mgnify:CR=1 FL=1
MSKLDNFIIPSVANNDTLKIFFIDNYLIFDILIELTFTKRNKENL